MQHSEPDPSDSVRRLSDEQKDRLAEYSSAFTFTDSDRKIAEDQYSDGQSASRQRAQRRRNKSVKHDKQWRLSHPERSVLRYSTGG